MTTKVLRDEDRLIGASGGRKWPTIAFDISVSPPMVVTPDNRRMRIVDAAKLLGVTPPALYHRVRRAKIRAGIYTPPVRTSTTLLSTTLLG